ncbi:response regulator [Paenibacillus macerans]|uniref:Response regulator n=2 Tax=Paenibacillus macerans TaxID=44252 RepID=A0A6N8EWX6_PAEMA|nr:response regulator [Paenibacillus macerans]
MIQMLKLAIVDDESLVRVGFQTIIDWQTYGYESLGVYRNGKEAWEAFCVEGYPDVLLTDIRMPEMDGLELIQKIRETDQDMIIIILSSFDEFEYARKSMQLGVQDYIPKHLFNPEELIALLNKLTAKKSKNAVEQTQVNRTAALHDEKQRLIMHSRLLSGIVAPASPISLHNYPLLSELFHERDTLFWVSFREWTEDNPYSESDLLAAGYLLHDLMNKSKYAVPLGIDYGVFHGLIQNPKPEENKMQFVADLVGDWTETVRNNLNVNVSAGISGDAPFEQCKTLRHCAEFMLDRSFFKGAGVYMFGPSASNGIQPAAHAWREQFIQLLKKCSIADILTWLERIEAEMGAHATPEEALELIRWMGQAYVKRQQEVNFIFTAAAVTAPDSSVFQWDEMERVHSWPALRRSFIAAIEAYETFYGNKRNNKPWLKPVFAYVEEYYAKGIRLEDAAMAANLNVNYFSHRFSQEMGMTFLEFVTRVRIHKAKELIKQHHLSAEEAASRVGYPNPNYFVKVFKKVTGKTLSEFRSSTY